MAVRIKERYEKRQILGEGGMGMVWVAYDHTLQREVAIKAIRDVRNRTALSLFQKECNTLAKMAHPNIVEIYDVGATEDNGQEVPYFVMPLLRGKTLDQLIREASSRLTVERCVDILMQVCRGLQAAHDQGLIHRDLKPSNIFVLQDDSVKIIDFGVAHLVDLHTTLKFAGTLLYMAPEQLQFKKPTPASDLFSLGVVAFEALTRRRPIDGGERDNLEQRILTEIPPPAFQLNPELNLPISQAIHKAMAKQPYQRFSSAKEFGDTLQKAQRDEPIEMFSRSRIEPRIQKVRKAIEQGELDLANEILSDVESEAQLHPELSQLRKATDEAIKDRTVRLLLETARRRFDEEEYQLALQKVQEVLNLDPASSAARTLAGEIESKRSSRQIDDWLRLARKHLENFAYGHARQALDHVFKERPKETRAQQLLSEVDRCEQEYQRVRQQKEQEYQAALDARNKGELSSAISRLERVLEMDRRAPDTFSADRAAVYQKLYNQVRSEHDQLTANYQGARRQLESGNFEAAMATCQEVLERFPENPLFKALKYDIEDRRRQEFSDFIARVDREVHAQADLDRKIRLLEEALARCPGETHLEGSLYLIRSRRDLVDSIVNEARMFEDKGQFGEAMGKWETLRNMYQQYPGLDVEIERVKKRKEHWDRTDAKRQWVQQIDHALNIGEFTRALELCAQGLKEYSGDAEILALEDAAKQALARQDQAQALLADAEFALASDMNQGISLLGEAHRLDPASPAIRQRLLDAILGQAKALIDSEWKRADEYLQQALDLDPGNALARSLKTLVQDRQHDRFVTEALSRSRACQTSGDLPRAISILDEALKLYPEDERLSHFRSTLKQKSEDAEREQDRRRDIEQVRTIVRESRTVVEKDELDSLFEKTRAIVTRYEGDKEFTEPLEELQRRLNRAQTKVDPPAQAYTAPTVPTWKAKLAESLRQVQAMTAQVAASFRSLAADIPRIRAGQLPWSRLGIPAFVIAGALLLLLGTIRIFLPVSEPKKPAVAATVPQPPVEQIPEPLAPVAVDIGPTVQLSTEIEGVQTTLAGVPLEAKAAGLFVMDRVPAGDKTLEITAPNGIRTVMDVRIHENALPEVVNLRAPNARVFVASTFQGVGRFFGFSPGEKVRIGLEEGTTEEVGQEGLSQEQLGTGIRPVFVEYGSDRRQHDIELTSAPALFVAMTSQEQNGTLKIFAGGTDVKVFINDRPRSFAARAGVLWMGLAPGKLRVRVERPEHFPEEQEVVLKHGEIKPVSFTLRPIPKMAQLRVRNATGMSVSVGGQPQRLGPEGLVTADVQPGRRRVEITKEGHRPYSREIDFVAGETEPIDASTINFERLVTTGEVIIQTIPPSAQIRIVQPDGRERSTHRPGEVITLPEGKHRYRASASGYNDLSGEFEVKAGQRSQVSSELSQRAVAAAPPPPPAMSGWTNASAWIEQPDGSYRKNDGGRSRYSTAAGTFEFTTPCNPTRLRKGCRGVTILLLDSPQGELRFEINDNEVKRTLGKATINTKLDTKITEKEMRLRVIVTNSRTTVEVNGQIADSVDGDFTKGAFAIESISMLKNFKYSSR